MRKAENEKKHPFANSMDQMANEARHISQFSQPKPNGRHPPINEVRSSVKEWGPGHPGWESIHGKR
jgi:hypothetical protein